MSTLPIINTILLLPEKPQNQQQQLQKKRRSKNSSSASAAPGGGGSSGIDSSTSTSCKLINYNDDTTIQPILEETISSSSFQPISLSQIQLRIKVLLDKLPSSSVLPEIPSDYIISPPKKLLSTNQIHSPHPLQIIIEEIQLTPISRYILRHLSMGVSIDPVPSQQNLSVDYPSVILF